IMLSRQFPRAIPADANTWTPRSSGPRCRITSSIRRITVVSPKPAVPQIPHIGVRGRSHRPTSGPERCLAAAGATPSSMTSMAASPKQGEAGLLFHMCETPEHFVELRDKPLNVDLVIDPAILGPVP